MSDVSSIITIVQVCIIGIIVPLTLIYAIPLMFIRRFCHRIHVFTINTSMAILFCSIYWLVVSILKLTRVEKPTDARTCSLELYAQTMCTLQVPLALVLVSIHRLSSVVYHNKIAFQNKRCISMCLIGQWLTGILIPLPFFRKSERPCVMSYWMSYYALAITIVIPMSVCVVANIIIWKHVKSSLRRIRPLLQPRIATDTVNQQSKINRRDIYLLRHMIIMFIVFVAGWVPIHIILILMNHIAMNIVVLSAMSLLAEISLLCDIIDLFLYSHKLRKYLRLTILEWCHA
ncbi:unnamed protein product [Rotaria socialis]|uniref:G-protein coupled receptors family 1 profile domain-containing protein n=1 Tax=Rotaria socialis TaxID=392032 RepID=A0A821AFQ3_9BILA|nr:unnamed protein product [Rotaria socialis]CAF3439246.1 unnamed protein product [Rotaria socialis]CAF3569169.1 unnamed protein product [Rotaria socialis]CAF4430734.1 unnamed protein product [Rotaria socialis]CAF4578356.1 unnamed protein product [Rotaria socialis]